MANRTVYLDALRAARGDWNRRDYSVRPMVRGKVIGIASDVHIPFHDERLCAEMLETFADRGVDTIVWLGDLLDLPYFSKYDLTETDLSFVRDLRIGKTLIEQAASIVERQYWSMGNHDLRAIRKAGYQIGLRQLALQMELHDMLEDYSLIVCDNPTLDAFDGQWALTHPDQYGSNPLVVPGKLAEKWHQDVIAGHAHHFAYGLSPSGQYEVVESGGLFDPRLFEYVQWHPTAGRNMTPGYWILDNGHPIPFRGEKRD